MRKLFNAAMITMITLLASANVMAEGSNEKLAKELISKYADSIIHASITFKISVEGPMADMIMPNGPQEKTQEATTTIIDPSGLAVASLSEVRPSSAMGAIEVQGASVKVNTEILAIKFIFPDGTEVPGKIVLEDDELDLVFIAPKNPLTADEKKRFKALDLTKAIKNQLSVLEEVVSVSRLGKTFRRVPSVSKQYINAIIKKPRLFYTPGFVNGTPAFNKDGEIVGISLKKKTSGGQMRISNMTIIRPLADILELVPQAKQEQNKKSE